jgi:hypothetical protein
MNELLARILDAHGGMERWRGYEKVEATIVSGGGLFALKGVLQDSNPRRMTAWLHEERSSVLPYGAPDQRTMFTPERIAIEKLDGTPVAGRYAPKDSFAGHQMHTPWDPLHRAYFNGEAMWTYLTTPFLLAMGSIETHSLIQDFFFDADLTLRRHDYSVIIAGGFAAAQLTSNYVTADGVRLPTKRRAHTRGPDRRPILEMLMVSIDISEVQFK